MRGGINMIIGKILKFVALATAFVLVLTTFACGRKEIVLLVAAPMSGEQEQAGKDMVSAVQAAADEWNAKGGVLGKKIVVIPGDDKGDADAAVNLAQELFGQGGRRHRSLQLLLHPRGHGGLLQEPHPHDHARPPRTPRLRRRVTPWCSESAGATISRVRARPSTWRLTSRGPRSRSSTTNPPTARSWPASS